jgi:hypothetical protein
MLQIAGVRFNTGTSERIRSMFQGTYALKQFPDGRSEDIEPMDIIIRENPCRHITDLMEPVTPSVPSLFFKDNTSYCLIFRHHGEQNTLQTVKFDKHGQHVSIFFNPEKITLQIRPDSSGIDQLLLMLRLAPEKGCIVHSAAMGLHGHGLMFTGFSGAGKSTLSTLLSRHPGFAPLSDERVVIRTTEQGPIVYGTPWHSDARIIGNGRFPLKAVFFLHHAPDNSIVPCPPDTALQRILPQVMIPWYDPDLYPKILDTCGNLIQSVPAYDFHFRPDNSAADAIVQFVRNQCQ